MWGQPSSAVRPGAARTYRQHHQPRPAQPRPERKTATGSERTPLRALYPATLIKRKECSDSTHPRQHDSRNSSKGVPLMPYHEFINDRAPCLPAVREVRASRQSVRPSLHHSPTSDRPASLPRRVRSRNPPGQPGSPKSPRQFHVRRKTGRPTLLAGCPISRVLCEKWGFPRPPLHTLRSSLPNQSGSNHNHGHAPVRARPPRPPTPSSRHSPRIHGRKRKKPPPPRSKPAYAPRPFLRPAGPRKVFPESPHPRRTPASCLHHTASDKSSHSSRLQRHRIHNPRHSPGTSSRRIPGPLLPTRNLRPPSHDPYNFQSPRRNPSPNPPHGGRATRKQRRTVWVGHSCPTTAASASTAKRKPPSPPQHVPPKSNPGRSLRRKRQRPRRRSPPSRTLLHRRRPRKIRPDHTQPRQPHPSPRNRDPIHPPRIRAPRHNPCPGLGHSFHTITLRKIFLAPILRPPRLHRNLSLDRPHPPALDHPAHQPHLARLLQSNHQPSPSKTPRRHNRSPGKKELSWSRPSKPALKQSLDGGLQPLRYLLRPARFPVRMNTAPRSSSRKAPT